MESEDSSSLSSSPSKKRVNDNSSEREHRLICLSSMTASLLNSDTDSTSEFDMEQHERLQNTDRKFCSLLIDGMITFLIK